MLTLLTIFALGALLAPLTVQRGRLGFLLLSLIPAISFGYLLSQRSRVLSGDFPEQNITWVPQLGLNLTFRLDGLSWLMALIVTGVGMMVLIYSSRYFSASAQGLSRFAGVFMGFAGAMLGLVTTNNTLALYLFWELTTVFSFLLIGHSFDRSSSRRAAMQALVLTTTGGLAMLAGIVILGSIPGGSFELSELIASARSGSLGVGTLDATPVAPTLVSIATALILLGAFTKSAIIPFHFWLPAAMAAPTPVSAYLHAAAMVKAGIYLIARLAPGFAYLQIWHVAILVTGIGTLILGGYRALRQTDLKLVLAFGTVSQLGLLTIMVGYGTSAMMLAGLAMLIAHALFKSSLFLSVGIVDWATGTRDLRKLSSMAKKMPIVATFAGIATASMMGLPPFLGFIAKESGLHALVGADTIATVTWIAIALGSVFTVAYSIRFWWGAFASKPGVEPLDIKTKSWLMIIPVGVLSLAGLMVGLFAPRIEVMLTPHARLLPGHEGHLVLWAGFSPAFFITLAIFVLGVVVFAVREPWLAITKKTEFPLRADRVFQGSLKALESLSRTTTSLIQRGSLPAYLITIFTFTLAVVASALIFGGTLATPKLRLYDSPAQLAVVIITAAAALIGARARHRLKAVLLIGISGYGVALTYELYGAPDLALTQTLAETMTLVLFILVLRRLPAYFSNRPIKLTRWIRIALAAVVGVSAATLAWLAAGARQATPVSAAFHDEAYYYGYGKNIVNVTLVDIRAWDTFGEISVVIAAAIGISSLLFIRDRGGRLDRFRNLPKLDDDARPVWQRTSDSKYTGPGPELANPNATSTVRVQGRNRLWLAGSNTLAAPRRSVIFEVGTRLIFHTMVIVSLYFLFAGHNHPGGGFAAGIMAGVALVLRYVAGGRYELGAALPLNPGHLMGTGITLAAIHAVLPLAFGGTIMQTVKIETTLPAFGDVKIASALLFDGGVYLVVIGLVLEILRSLGAEIDRHGEIEGFGDLDDAQIYPVRDLRRDEQEADQAQQCHLRDAIEEHQERTVRTEVR
ncbi:Na+/H+ antiporter subunit A [Arcanobacterium ihumii]|uniref:Na+/H+ antiporter subunit A n=1 Tax=Arcanobacterium ihumii TaxID=2138162 RepID=UPI000F51B9EF|nr:Na+/H+ antiporter subunit A [Arcanobacterium ihumii]